MGIFSILCIAGLISNVQSGHNHPRPTYPDGACYGRPINNCENNDCDCGANDKIVAYNGQGKIEWAICAKDCHITTAGCPTYFDIYKESCAPLERCFLLCSIEAHCPTGANCQEVEIGSYSGRMCLYHML
ncbi:hypothetical protein Pmar_PMAR021350 [Perkinsus marinus ATCC 50983]|uniref:Uncharacterized protein n=1 Tax=Perkinsus marinus (strain ATCC 50983 / TXsc) TaxID=423536 RepID=C5KMC2_PERM5|nr:hypothetical protein Pmar_PMAR021350 [Perkinsus marinus ATCC 50983]EER14376.1 hypothetical protein Pmar_PMAR021350 [Perkinsus marinus ATCC 50983]|eukprot:XP_002782581.1 hypothetical protein Pmar_PMAR021350 [Perkinsus marinus ATCC 50983]